MLKFYYDDMGIMGNLKKISWVFYMIQSFSPICLVFSSPNITLSSCHSFPILTACLNNSWVLLVRQPDLDQVLKHLNLTKFWINKSNLNPIWQTEPNQIGSKWNIIWTESISFALQQFLWLFPIQSSSTCRSENVGLPIIATTHLNI